MLSVAAWKLRAIAQQLAMTAKGAAKIQLHRLPMLQSCLDVCVLFEVIDEGKDVCRGL